MAAAVVGVVNSIMRFGQGRVSAAFGDSVGNRSDDGDVIEVRPADSTTGGNMDSDEKRVRLEDAAGGGVLALPWQWYTSLKWCPTSEAHLIEAERRIMSKVKIPFTGRRVDFISPDDHEEHHIWTLCFKQQNLRKLKKKSEDGSGDAPKKGVPLVMIHGFGNGAAFWCGNFEAVAEGRDVYAFDMPGFARSYRPKFCTDPKRTENYYIHCLEEWRKQMNLDKMILLGHSMGGFVVSRYTCTYPSRVAHLILVDPWGLSTPPNGVDWTKPIPLWIRSAYMTRINPLKIVRAMGPFGPLISKIGAYYAWNRYSWFLEDEATAMADYLFHGNVLASSGEDAFEALTDNLFWAKHPALDDLTKVDPNLGISFVYGAQSWLDSTPGLACKEKRPDSYVSIDVVDNSGHDIFADAPQKFNEVVVGICTRVDEQN